MKRVFLWWSFLLAILVFVFASMPPASSWQIQKALVSGCSAVTPDLWSSTYFFGAGGGSPYVTVSGGGIVSQAAIAGNNDTIIEIGTRCHTTGKYYFEFNPVISLGGDSHRWGLAAATHGNRTALGSGAPTDSIAYSDFAGSRAWRYAGFLGSNVGMTQPLTGQAVGIAIDLTVGLVWIINVTVSPSTWYGSDTNPADPATNTNGYAFTPLAIPLYIAWESAQNGGPNTGATICTKAACFAGSIPAGYSAWDTNP